MLWAEQRADVQAGGDGAIGDVPERRVDRRGIADEADGSASQQLPIEQDVGTESDAH